MHKAAGIQKTLDATDDSQQHSQQQRLNRCYQPGGIGWRLFWSKVPLRSSNHKWYLSAMHNSVKSSNHWVTTPCTIMSLPFMEHRCAHRKVELHGPYGVFFLVTLLSIINICHQCHKSVQVAENASLSANVDSCRCPSHSGYLAFCICL